MKTSIALVFLAPGAVTSALVYAVGQPILVVIWAGAIMGIVWVISFMCLFESAPATSRGEFLDYIARNLELSREYYGDSQIKPNDHCHYVRHLRTIGWYENDDTLRDRIAEKLHNAKN